MLFRLEIKNGNTVTLSADSEQVFRKHMNRFVEAGVRYSIAEPDDLRFDEQVVEIGDGWLREPEVCYFFTREASLRAERLGFMPRRMDTPAFCGLGRDICCIPGSIAGAWVARGLIHRVSRDAWWAAAINEGLEVFPRG